MLKLFQLSVAAESCKILKDSLKRFYSRAFPGRISAVNMKSKMNNAEGLLDQVEIVFANENGCENNPHENMDETCKFFQRISSNPKPQKTLPIKNVSAYNNHQKYLF